MANALGWQPLPMSMTSDNSKVYIHVFDHFLKHVQMVTKVFIIYPPLPLMFCFLQTIEWQNLLMLAIFSVIITKGCTYLE